MPVPKVQICPWGLRPTFVTFGQHPPRELCRTLALTSQRQPGNILPFPCLTGNLRNRNFSTMPKLHRPCTTSKEQVLLESHPSASCASAHPKNGTPGSQEGTPKSTKTSWLSSEQPVGLLWDAGMLLPASRLWCHTGNIFAVLPPWSVHPWQTGEDGGRQKSREPWALKSHPRAQAVPVPSLAMQGMSQSSGQRTRAESGMEQCQAQGLCWRWPWLQDVPKSH